jgi:DNA-binding beta-propeller fold protein YncE
MKTTTMLALTLGTAIVTLALLPDGRLGAQTAADPNAAPNPYTMQEGWAKLPAGRKWGSTIGVDVSPDGKTIWTFDRCAANNCIGSSWAPIMKFDRASGEFLGSFGIGMFNGPHGFHVDRDGNVWASDAAGRGGKGHTVFKFSPDGKLLMTLGKPGIEGDGTDTFNRPTDIFVAPNGDIFVSDGHGDKSNARIVKFAKDGKFIKAWGKEGKAQGEFDTPHTLAMDSAGRLFVGDRSNNRIQIFDQDGKFLAEWKQFGRPSGLYIDKNDILYSADHQSGDNEGKVNPGFKKGIRIGSVKDAKVTAFIPEVPGQGMPEGVLADGDGIVYGTWTGQMNVRRYVKK